MKFFFLVVFLVCFSQSAWADRHPLKECFPWMMEKNPLLAQKCQQEREERAERTKKWVKEWRENFAAREAEYQRRGQEVRAERERGQDGQDLLGRAPARQLKKWRRSIR